MDERALSDVRANRARLQRDLGDPDQVRSEREGIENAMADLRREHDQVRGILAERTIERRPEWLIEALGQRPGSGRNCETWDQAARTVAGFRLDQDVVDRDMPLGPEPPGNGERRRDWNEANAALQRAQRQLGHEPTARDRGIDLGVG